MRRALRFVLLVASFAGRAAANGRFPAADHVVLGPAAFARAVALRTTFGFALSDDGGRSFHWLCEAALGYEGMPFDPAAVFDSRGRLLIGLGDGLARLGTDRCAIDRVALLAGQYVLDLDATATGANVMAVVSTGTPTRPDRLYRSDDGAEHFAPAATAPSGVHFTTAEMAPSAPARVYVAGGGYPPRRPVVFRSDDGGRTLTPLPFPTGISRDDAFIAAVSPVDADVLYVRLPLVESVDAGATGAAGGTALLQSVDGGQHWRAIARTSGAMLGLAVSDDGRTVYLGTTDVRDGLARSDDGGANFHRVADLPVRCLCARGGDLYACTDGQRDGVVLQRSRDRAASFEALLDLGGLLPPVACPASSPVTLQCAPRWPAQREELSRLGAATTPERDAATRGDATASAPRDAASETSRDATGAVQRGGRCDCAVAGAPRTATGPRAFAFVVLAGLSAMRRARPRARTRRRAHTT